MLLSKLVYLCVKNTIYYDDSSFTYLSFKQGRFDGDPDYSVNINNVFSPLNLAIARLNELNKIPFSVSIIASGDSDIENINGIPTNCLPEGVELSTVVSGTPASQCDISDIKDEIKEIVGLSAVENDGTIRPLNYIFSRALGIITIQSYLYYGDKICLEYKKDIPFFSNSSEISEDGYYYFYQYDLASTGEISSTPSTEIDPELKDYNITDFMCNYIMEYVKGCLLEPIDMNRGNMHLTRAEQYFMNIPPCKNYFGQQVVENVYYIGE